MELTASAIISNSSNQQNQNLNAFCAIFLAIFTIISFTANIFLIVTISSSYRLRNYVINFFLLNLAVVNLLDTIVNMVLTLLYVTMCRPEQCDWRLGQTVCNFNSFAVQLVSVESLFALALLGTDRAVALLNMNKYKQRLTPVRTAVAIVCAWIVGLCFCFPLLIGSIASRPFTFRYFCSVDNGAPIAYPILVVVFCYALPILVILAAFGVIYHRAHLERSYRQAMRPDLHYTDREHIIDTRRFQDYLVQSKFIVALFIIFVLFQGPYVLMNYMGQIANSREIYSDTAALLSVPRDSETAITWIKFLFPVVLPFIVFAFCRDIWRKLQDLLCCRKTSVIKRRMRNDAPINDLDDAGGSAANARVATLVATTDGLHVEQIRTDEHGNIIAEELQFADHPPRGAGRHGNRLGAGATRTSDYDSGSDSDSVDSEARRVTTSAGKARSLKTEIIAGNIQKTELEVEVPVKPKPRLNSLHSPGHSAIFKQQNRVAAANVNGKFLSSSAGANNVGDLKLESIDSNHKRTQSDSSLATSAKQSTVSLLPKGPQRILLGSNSKRELILNANELNSGNANSALPEAADSCASDSSQEGPNQSNRIDRQQTSAGSRPRSGGSRQDSIQGLGLVVSEAGSGSGTVLQPPKFTLPPVVSPGMYSAGTIIASGASAAAKEVPRSGANMQDASGSNAPAGDASCMTQSSRSSTAAADTASLLSLSANNATTRNQRRSRRKHNSKESSRFPNLPTSAELRDIKHLPLLDVQPKDSRQSQKIVFDGLIVSTLESVASGSRESSGDSENRELISSNNRKESQLTKLLQHCSAITRNAEPLSSNRIYEARPAAATRNIPSALQPATYYAPPGMWELANLQTRTNLSNFIADYERAQKQTDANLADDGNNVDNFDNQCNYSNGNGWATATTDDDDGGMKASSKPRQQLLDMRQTKSAHDNHGNASRRVNALTHFVQQPKANFRQIIHPSTYVSDVQRNGVGTNFKSSCTRRRSYSQSAVAVLEVQD